MSERTTTTAIGLRSKRLALLVSSALFSILLAQLTLRLFGFAYIKLDDVVRALTFHASPVLTVTPGNIRLKDQTVRARPGQYLAIEHSSTGNPIFRVTYTIDDLGRRLTPVDRVDARDQFILFFVDSFAFGHGVENTQTLPAEVGRLTRRYLPYNYGYPGLSTDDLELKLRKLKLSEQVAQTNGILIYVFIDVHVQRVVKAAPDPERPWYLGLYSRLHRRPGSLWTSQGDREWVATLVRRAQDAFHRQYPNGRFYVLLYPQRGAQMGPLFEKEGVACLDYSMLFDWKKDRAYVLANEDTHPSAAAYRAVAQAIVTDLNLE